jgi:mono/diheme cytochrome c family protein
MMSRKRTNRLIGLASVLIVLIIAVMLGLREPDSLAQDSALATTRPSNSARVVAATPEQAGKYLVTIGGCNDCHTPGFMQKGLDVPEDDWLTGLPIGWRGPWGTTYGANLRLTANLYNSADGFIAMLRGRNARPPMPWASVHAMSDEDLRAVFQYLKQLGPKGELMPTFVPPGEEPKTPYFLFDPQMPKQ